jgi:hypothetical protein
MAKNQIDHLMYAVKNLDEGIERFHELTGVKAVYGGLTKTWEPVTPCSHWVIGNISS